MYPYVNNDTLASTALCNVGQFDERDDYKVASIALSLMREMAIK